MNLPLNPESRFKIAWEIYILLITVLITILAPLFVVFDMRSTRQFHIIDIIVTISFVIDIMISFNSAFMVKMNLITDRKIIARRYLKSWFLWDLIAAIPFSWFLSITPSGSIARTVRFFRLGRLFKLLVSSKTLKRVHKINGTNPALMRLFLLIFWIFVASHLIACGWIFIEGPIVYMKTEAITNGVIYLEAFYWTVTTLTTIGYGDITPQTPVQFVYAIFVMLLGAAIYGFIIGNIANIIANIDVAKSQFRDKIENIDTFLKYRNIPVNLQKRIHEYYDYLWQTRRCYDESTIIEELPKSLKTQVSLFLNKNIIAKVPFFQKADIAFIKDIILNLKPVICTPGERIVTHGEIGYEMYFISRGEVAVRNETETVTYATLSTGQFFGEIALLLSSPRTATVRAKTYCDLYMLDKKTFDSILQNYPKFADELKQLAEKRRKVIQMMEHERATSSLTESGGVQAQSKDNQSKGN